MRHEGEGREGEEDESSSKFPPPLFFPSFLFAKLMALFEHPSPLYLYFSTSHFHSLSTSSLFSFCLSLSLLHPSQINLEATFLHCDISNKDDNRKQPFLFHFSADFWRILFWKAKRLYKTKICCMHSTKCTNLQIILLFFSTYIFI